MIVFAAILSAHAQNTTLGPVQGSKEGVTAPILIKQVKPKYPHSLFSTPPTGVATVGLNLNTEGIPQDLRILQSAGNDKLDQSALDAVRQYRFKPAMKEGHPVMVDMKIEVHFTIR